MLVFGGVRIMGSQVTGGEFGDPGRALRKTQPNPSIACRVTRDS